MRKNCLRVETESQLQAHQIDLPDFFPDGPCPMELGDPQNLAFESVTTSTRPLCHCLNVTECEVRDVISENELQTVRGVSNACGAGSGCTACHRHIKRLLNEQAVKHRLQSLADTAGSLQLSAGSCCHGEATAY